MSVSGTSAMQALDPNAFLKLFITQIKHQDPTAPLDPGQMMSSLAQMTTVQNLNTISQDFQRSLSTERLRLARELIGSQVGYPRNGQTATGVVESAQVQKGQVGVVVGGQFVPVDTVTQIAPAPIQPK